MEIYSADFSNEICSNKHQGLRHLAFGSDNIEAEYERLKNEVKIEKALEANAKGVKTFFLRDLEVNLIHFVQRLFDFNNRNKVVSSFSRYHSLFYLLINFIILYIRLVPKPTPPFMQ